MDKKIKNESIIKAIDQFHIEQKKEHSLEMEILCIENEDMTDFVFENVDLSFVYFVNCILDNAVFENVYMCNTHFTNTSLKNAKFKGPAKLIYLQPLFNNCITNDLTVFPKEFSYINFTGYIILEDNLLQVIASGNNGIDYDEEKHCCFVPSFRVLKCESLTNNTSPLFNCNEIIDAYDYDEDFFKIYENKEEIISYYNAMQNKKKLYSYTSIPCIVSKKGTTVEDFATVAMNVFNIEKPVNLVLKYSKYNKNNQTIEKTVTVLIDKNTTYKDLCSTIYKQLYS